MVFRTSFPEHSFHNIISAGILCSVCAVSDEWHPTLVPRRGGRLTEVLIDFGRVCLEMRDGVHRGGAISVGAVRGWGSQSLVMN